MLPGDIDLTQNLDFRKQLKKELPSFPDAWNADDRINRKLSYNYLNNNRYTQTNSVITRINNIYSSQYYITYSDYNTTTPQRAESYIYYNNQSIRVEYNSGDTYLTTTSTNDYVTISKYTDPEKDIFGNIIEIKQKQHTKCSLCGELLMPWEKKYCSNCNKKFKTHIKNIPWENQNKFKHNLFIYDDYDGIPWETEEYLFDDGSKSQEPICYLADKSQSFIERYLNRNEEDNTSYLTNMNWIGVRDAVVE